MCVCVCVRKEGDCFVWVCGGLWLGDTRESRVCGLRCESQMGVGMKHVLAMFSTKFLKERQTNHASKQETTTQQKKSKHRQKTHKQDRHRHRHRHTDTQDASKPRGVSSTERAVGVVAVGSLQPFPHNLKQLKVHHLLHGVHNLLLVCVDPLQQLAVQQHIW